MLRRSTGNFVEVISINERSPWNCYALGSFVKFTKRIKYAMDLTLLGTCRHTKFTKVYKRGNATGIRSCKHEH